MNPALQRLGRGLIDAVFPPTCVQCRGLITTEIPEAGAVVTDAGIFRYVCRRCVT